MSTYVKHVDCMLKCNCVIVYDISNFTKETGPHSVIKIALYLLSL